jgi:hypothetical protein
MARAALALAALAACAACAAATVELTAKDFDQQVFKSGKATFVKFLTPW